ncbi:MAG TPA: DMT family transporter [Patescibacteria group bacterium]|jgi:drug/metabolite transporter (DMT)-like permease|nr:DMT family transporter [Patescibacteria group bacterium]
MNPYIEILFVSFIWGTAGTFVKILHLPSTTLTFFRVAIPTVILFIYLSIKRVRLFRGNNTLLLIASAINAVRLLIYYMAYNLASIGNVSIAGSTTSMFIFLFSFLFLKEKVTVKKLVLLASAFIGLCVLYSNKPLTFVNKDFLGMSFMLLSTALYAITVIIFKKELSRYSKTETIFYQNVVGTLIFLPFLFINKPFPAVWQVSLASTSGFFIGLVAFVLYFSALKRVSATVSSLAMIDTVISVILSAVIFHEHLYINMIIGGLIILCTSFYISRELSGPKIKDVVQEAIT